MEGYMVSVQERVSNESRAHLRGFAVDRMPHDASDSDKIISLFHCNVYRETDFLQHCVLLDIVTSLMTDDKYVVI